MKTAAGAGFAIYSLRMKRYVVVCLLLSIGVPVWLGGQTSSPHKTVWDGVYSAEQAARGEEAYKERCSRCHGGKLEGTQGNGLVGSDFMERWREDSMSSLYEFVSRNMPPAQRGAGRPLIPVPTYLDILAYVLAQNQFPAGANSLAAEGLDDIQIQYKDGPHPMPNGALVRVCGCLTGSDQKWSITSANDPIRTKTADTTDFMEFQAAQAEKSGTQTYRLANLGLVAAKFKPEAHVGERVMVKGTLARQQDSSVRISILGVRKVADTCQ